MGRRVHQASSIDRELVVPGERVRALPQEVRVADCLHDHIDSLAIRQIQNRGPQIVGRGVDACIRPRLWASSSRSSRRPTAIIRAAPRYLAMHTKQSPTGPVPSTTTLRPRNGPSLCIQLSVSLNVMNMPASTGSKCEGTACWAIEKAGSAKPVG